jgi:hypothetical protein
MYGTLERAGLIRELGAETIFRHEPALLAATFKAIHFAEWLLAEARAQQKGKARA